MNSPEPTVEDMSLPDQEEIAAAVHHLSRYDPVSYLHAITALVRDIDDD